MIIEGIEVKDRRTEVYDIETIKSCFTYTGFNIDTQEVSKFVIHKELNQLKELTAHLYTLKAQIGFNNVNFDYPVIHYIIKNANTWWDKSAEEVITLIYAEAQRLISSQNTNRFGLSIRDKDVLIPQLDLFKMWHYDNKAKMTSLKSLEISMNYPNVMDMPIEHNREDIQYYEIESILEYNLNDVLATYEFYKKSIPKIDLRKQIKKKYGISCANYSDSKIGESLLLDLYCKHNNLSPWDVKKLRSPRPNGIKLNDLIFDYIKFNSNTFNKLLSNFKSLTINGTKGGFSQSVLYKGFMYEYGLGGIHGCIKAGVYESDDKYIIIDCDVASLYPNVAIKNRLYIEHLGESFIDLYDNDIVQERLRAKKAGEMSISDALKLSANSVYGKSNDQYSFLYDPQYTMATTINGQLLLTMLAERFVDNIKDITMIQANTDGITVMIPRNQQDLYYEICNQWMKDTMLELEYVDYSKMIIRDVNNYMAVTTKGKVKYKGAFEIDKVIGTEPAYHKDNSFRIIPLAISEYFVNGIPIEETVYNHKDIYDFCGRQKFGRDSYGEIHYLNYSPTGISYDEALELYNQEWTDYYDNSAIKKKWIEDRLPYDRMAVDKDTVIQNIISKSKISSTKVEKQQKNVRYYISKSGKTFIKQYLKGSSEAINKGYQVEIFNKYVEKEFSQYKVDYTFYIEEAYKIINIIDNKQLQLF